MSGLRSKSTLVIVALALLFGLFIFRPGADRLRGRVAKAISLSVGRRVDISALNLRVLPRPGFDLSNFTLYDDVGFGAEPMLFAPEVSAAIRLSALFRGKLEIARLGLTDPSVNLTRCDGVWNIESLIERNSKSGTLPSAEHGGREPAFPYIEADNARVNIKFCREKKPFILTQANFAVWQASASSWGMRLKAQPTRTDLNLSDTGTLRVDGTWQRAATARDTPFQLSLEWDAAQLGQASKLAYGTDKGWRGTLKFGATLAGTAQDLALKTTATVRDFRRYDITGGGNLQLGLECTARAGLQTRVLTNVDCKAPLQKGALRLRGNISGLLSHTGFDLSLDAQDVPMQSLVALAQHAKKNLPDDLSATGKLDATLKLRHVAGAPLGEISADGGGEALGFELRSKGTDTAVIVGRVPFLVGASIHPASVKLSRPDLQFPSSPDGSELEIGPLSLDIGGVSPAIARAWISPSAYSIEVSGQGQFPRFAQVARTIGMPPLPASKGTADFDMQVVGKWSGFAPASVLGSAQLRSVRAEIMGFNQPLEITSANLQFSPQTIDVQNLSFTIAGGNWRGSLKLPRQCSAPCPVELDLHADEISTDRLNALLNPALRKRPWYNFLDASAPQTSRLKTLRVSGNFTADRVVIRRLAGTRVSSHFEMEDGKLSLTQLNGSVLGGSHTGEWRADFNVSPPAYIGNGVFVGIALGQLAQAMHDPWITGTADSTYEAAMSGLNSVPLLSSAKATLQVQARDGLLAHLALASIAPTHYRRFSGTLLLSDGRLDIQDGKLESSPGTYVISGTAFLNRKLQMEISRTGDRFLLTGTLAQPRITAVDEKEPRAALQP